jgi:hypothetical protein
VDFYSAPRREFLFLLSKPEEKTKNLPTLIQNLNLRRKTKLESLSPMNEHEESSSGSLSRHLKIIFGKY